jgi:hypothetical protein
MRLVVALAVVAASSAAFGTRAAPDAGPVRAELPIREVVLSDGMRRYTVPIKVGATAIETGLDTGSVGLRILQRGLADGDVRATGQYNTYAYGSGATLNGVVGDANLTLDALSGPVRLQIVRTLSCTPDLPHCPVSRVSAAQYGIEGDGLPGEGFIAIMGVNMDREEIANPLEALGAKRWIVELPRPGETAPGRLVLNPTDAETAGFVMISIADRSNRGGLHDSLDGCLVNDATKAKACGLASMDSGGPGIRVANGGLGHTPWAQGSAATLVFYDKAGHPQAAENLVIGLRSHASNLSFIDAPGLGGAIVFAGISPYFAFDVLYDPVHGLIGLKARPPTPDGPQGLVN